MFARPAITLEEVRPQPRAGGLARGDVPVLLGLCQRGPVLVPVRVESLRAAEAVFGPGLPGGHLHDALKGFFETGGRACYILRLAGAAAGPAAVTFGLWRAEAQVALAALGTGEWLDGLRGGGRLALRDPGPWGAGLTLRVARAAPAFRTAELDEAGRVLRPQSLQGLAGVVELVRGAEQATARVTLVDRATGEVHLDRAVLDAGPVAVNPVLFDVAILVAGERREAYPGLSPDPDHPRPLSRVVQAESRLAGLEGPVAAAGADPADPVFWPQTGDWPLAGGSDDPAGLTPARWIDGVAAQSVLAEPALILAPDLVRQPLPPRRDDSPGPVPAPACARPDPLPLGGLALRVVNAQGHPVPGARVVVAGQGATTVSDTAGRVTLTGLPLAQSEVRIGAPGYQPLDSFLVPRAGAGPLTPDAARTIVTLIPEVALPVLDPAGIESVQRAMCDPFVTGPWRVALLDPPARGMTPEALIGWRGRLGQTDRGVTLAPWVMTPAGDLSPPSGHVAGAFARAEAAEGIHRSPANIPLRHAKGLDLAFDDPALEVFHQGGVNPLRALPGQGIRLMGSRTLSADADWQQVTTRRLIDAIERTLVARLAWVVFEPVGPATAAVLRHALTAFLETLRLRGMLAGAEAAQAFDVEIDATGAPRGELVIDLALAPARPLEFIRVRLSAQADRIDVTEDT